MVAQLRTTEIIAWRHSKTCQATTHFTEYHPKFALRTQIPHTGGNANRCMESVCMDLIIMESPTLIAPTKPVAIRTTMRMANIFQINGHLVHSSCNSFLLKWLRRIVINLSDIVSKCYEISCNIQVKDQYVHTCILYFLIRPTEREECLFQNTFLQYE